MVLQAQGKSSGSVGDENGKEYYQCMRLRSRQKWKSTCLGIMRPRVQSPVPSERNRGRQRERDRHRKRHRKEKK
jgi:hypothetical protein